MDHNNLPGAGRGAREKRGDGLVLMRGKVLVIDDEKNILLTVKMALAEEGYDVITTGSARDALKLLEKEPVDMALVDIMMPEMDGMDFLRVAREKWDWLQIVMMSGHGTIQTAVDATKLGAYGFLEKPLSREKLLVTIQRALEARRLEYENRELRTQLEERFRMVGGSREIENVRRLINQIGPTNSRVLIRGENGTGKELVARGLHAASARADNPFIKVNCAAIPKELIESELFGHEKGAFTGATGMRLGKFQLADTGTIFLDEIGDMHPETQAKVLRVLEANEIERVGGSRVIKVDVRVIAASNKDLLKEIAEERFREDLYFRLNVIPFEVPTLRARKDDIPPLVEHFVNQYRSEYGRSKKKLSADAIEALKEYNWPGNVRELKNMVERIYIMAPGNEVGAGVVLEFLPHGRPGAEARTDTSAPLKEAMTRYEHDYILAKLKENGFSVSETAKKLELERSHLYKKIRALDIKLPKNEVSE
ncbi:MAG: sigma-54 dependent transcriptional regulator [bacterium]